MAAGIGETLRATRRQQRLSLEEAAAEIRVREPYLAALEEEKFAKLGGDVYVRAFLRGYSEFLGLDPDQIVEAYRREYERGGRTNGAPEPATAALPPPVAEVPPQPQPLRTWQETPALPSSYDHLPSPQSWEDGENLEGDLEERSSFFPRAVVLAGVVLLLLVVAALALRRYGPTEVAAGLQQPVTSEAVVIPTPTTEPAETAIPTTMPTAEATPTAEAVPAPTPTPTPVAPPPPQGPLTEINVELTVTDGPSWMRATVDGSVVEVGIYEPGTTFTWSADQSLVLRIGDASNVRLVLNGVDQGVLGGDRETRDLEYRIGQVPA